MQTELRAAPVTKRYFGRDLTNIDNSHPQKPVFNEVKPSFPINDEDRREKLRQNVYRPLTNKIPTFIHKNSKSDMPEMKIPDELGYRSKMDVENVYYNRISLQGHQYYANLGEGATYQRGPIEAAPRLEPQPKEYLAQRGHVTYGTNISPNIPADHARNQYGAMNIEYENVYRAEKSSYLPTTKASELYTLPLGHIWNHLIVYQVDRSNQESQHLFFSILEQPARCHRRDALDRH